jgi:hypothetical protein
MKPLSWDKQLGLALPLKCAAIQSGQTNNPSKNETGLDASHHARIFPRGGENLFFLTSSFRGEWNRLISTVAVVSCGRLGGILICQHYC